MSDIDELKKLCFEEIAYEQKTGRCADFGLDATRLLAIIKRLEAAEHDAKRWQIASTSRNFGITNWCEFGQRTSYDGQAEKIIDTAIAAEQGNKHDH